MGSREGTATSGEKKPSSGEARSNITLLLMGDGTSITVDALGMPTFLPS